MSGGGQERGMRSGTLPTPLCVGIGAACELAMQEMEVNLIQQYYSLLIIMKK
jgi:cysteine sulfinate desulfinase/cysteine desulfurase-like protein